MVLPNNTTPGKQVANVLLIGDSAVGKTSLVNVNAGKGFQEAHMATLGLEFIQ